MAVKSASSAARPRIAPTPIARGASWFVALAAFALIAVSLGSYLYHRRQLDTIAAKHLRLVVAGPGQLQAGAPSVYTLLATTVTGEPWAAPIEWSLTAPDGKRLVDRKEATDDQGRLTMVVPADMDLRTRTHGRAQLTVAAGGVPNPPSVTLPLPIRPASDVTRLWLDRRHYRSGDTVYFRSLTVAQYSLAAIGAVPLEFEILDPKLVPLPESRTAGITDRGIGNGAFRLPDNAPAGSYTLVARGWEDAFPEERLTFEVAGPASPHHQVSTKFARGDYGPGDDVTADLFLTRPDGKPAAGASLQVAAKFSDQTIFQKIAKADDAGKLRVEFALPSKLPEGRGQLIVTVDGEDRGDSITEFIPIRGSSLQIEFHAEGGRLAAGIENRVYVVARDAQGRPASIRGNIIDGKGATVAHLETAASGLGVFSLMPDAAETYRLKVTAPAAIKESPLLPPAMSDQKIAINTGRSVFAPGDPLAFSIHSVKDRIPLVVTAEVRGMLVGQQLLVASGSDSHSQASKATIPLDDRIAGLIRLSVYDYSKSPPQVVAERFVYRQPRRLVVRAVQGKKPGGEWSIAVQNEKGQPVAAGVSLCVFDVAKDGAKESKPPTGGPSRDLLHALCLDHEQAAADALAGVDLNLADLNADSPALDLALGCLGNRLSAKADESKRAASDAVSPPEVHDNLVELRTQYEATLSDYRAKRTHVVNALIMLSFFGGLALALLVTMLALLRIVWGSRLWLPTVVATVCCVVVTAVSNEPSRMKPVEATAVGFAPFVPPIAAPDDAARAAAPPASSSADRKLRSLAEKLGKLDGDAEGVITDRFPIHQYTSPDLAQANSGKAGDRPVAWYPLLKTGADGRLPLPDLAPLARPFRLLIDAQGDSGFDSSEVLVK